MWFMGKSLGFAADFSKAVEGVSLSKTVLSPCCYSAQAFFSPQELGAASPSSAVLSSAGFNSRLLPFWFHLREISASLIFPLLCRSPLCNCQLRPHPDEPFSESQRKLRELCNQEASKKCSLIPSFCRDPELSAGWVCIVEPQDASWQNPGTWRRKLGQRFGGTSHVIVLGSSRCSVSLSCLPGDLPQAQTSVKLCWLFLNKGLWW